MVKNGHSLIDHGTLKSFDELSILIEWFLHADSDGVILGLVANNLLCIIFGI